VVCKYQFVNAKKTHSCLLDSHDRELLTSMYWIHAWILYFITLNNNAYKMLTKIIPPSWDI